MWKINGRRVEFLHYILSLPSVWWIPSPKFDSYHAKCPTVPDTPFPWQPSSCFIVSQIIKTEILISERQIFSHRGMDKVTCRLDKKLESIGKSFHKIVNEDLRNKADAREADTLS